jgi:hypothetical protein
VHYVNDNGRCVPSLVHDPDENGKANLTVFWGPGAMTARFGVEYLEWDQDQEFQQRSWHYDCPNTQWDQEAS